MRNYFEVGTAMEKLVTVDERSKEEAQVGVRTPARRTSNIGLGRERR